MTFISYAQNFEDVMLRRVLKDIEPGFYIDVGAAWPDQDSVTKAFYQGGWSGINVEPNPVFHDLLCAQRSRDINLQLAVADRPGQLVMHFIEGTGLSSADDSIVEAHKRSGWRAVDMTVTQATLASIWQSHVPMGQEVHFLKVDVEGLEDSVLRGNDWQACRPWIVLVEATLPLSQIESYAGWESLLLENGYGFAYADGLNRFYVANEHPELLPAFKFPPNVFDEFERVSEVSARNRSQSLESANRMLTLTNQDLENRLDQAQATARAAQQHIEDIHQSTSWRVTRPLRAAAQFARPLRTKGREILRQPRSIAVRGARKILRPLVPIINRFPLVKSLLIKALDRIPGVKARIVRVLNGLPGRHSLYANGMPMVAEHLSVHANRVHAELQAAIGAGQREKH